MCGVRDLVNTPISKLGSVTNIVLPIGSIFSFCQALFVNHCILQAVLLVCALNIPSYWSENKYQAIQCKCFASYSI